ncbi:MAG: response regulator transcription factor [Blastocatellia bacterium]
MKEIRLIIADDHPVVRQGLRLALTIDPSLVVVAEAGDGQTALAQIVELQPDVVILDINMPHLGGFEVARALQQTAAPTALIFLTIHCEEDLFETALELGVRGYVLKDSAIAEIVTAIKTVAGGGQYTSPTLVAHLMKNRRAARSAPISPLDALTPTERRILRLIAEYLTSKDIADQLNISYRTVETHRTNICTKLDIHGSHALMKFALERKDEL